MTISMSLVFLEILLVIPFTNVKVEYLSSTMTCVKKDWQNRLSQDKVDAVLRVKEEGKKALLSLNLILKNSLTFSLMAKFDVLAYHRTNIQRPGNLMGKKQKQIL